MLMTIRRASSFVGRVVAGVDVREPGSVPLPDIPTVDEFVRDMRRASAWHRRTEAAWESWTGCCRELG
jgi:hypothetical protein